MWLVFDFLLTASSRTKSLLASRTCCGGPTTTSSGSGSSALLFVCASASAEQFSCVRYTGSEDKERLQARCTDCLRALGEAIEQEKRKVWRVGNSLRQSRLANSPRYRNRCFPVPPLPSDIISSTSASNVTNSRRGQHRALGAARCAGDRRSYLAAGE